jgi:transposase
MKVQVWFQDEARFGQQGTLTRQWARRGTRPMAWRQTQYEYLYVLGAACPQTGQTVGLLAPYLNTDSVNAFFREFEKEVDPAIHVFMIWDQAGFHTSQKVKVPENVTLVPLPPYSPQLNPIETLWLYLRQHHWSNRVYDGYDHLRQAANDAWHKVCLNTTKIKSICRAKYIESALI